MEKTQWLTPGEWCCPPDNGLKLAVRQPNSLKKVWLSRALEIEMELDLKSNVKTEFPKKCEWLLFIFLGKFSFYNSSFSRVRHCLRGSVRPPKTTVPWNPLNSFFGILSQWYLELKQSGKNKQNFTNNSGFFFQKWGKWAQNWLIWYFLYILKDFAIIFFAWYHSKWKIILSYPSSKFWFSSYGPKCTQSIRCVI